MDDIPFFGDYGYVPPPAPPTPSIPSGQSSDSSSNTGWIFFVLIMLLGFVSLVIYYFTKEKTEDEIYTNLLNQNQQNDLDSRGSGRRWITPDGQIYYSD